MGGREGERRGERRREGEEKRTEQFLLVVEQLLAGFGRVFRVLGCLNVRGRGGVSRPSEGGIGRWWEREGGGEREREEPTLNDSVDGAGFLAELYQVGGEARDGSAPSQGRERKKRERERARKRLTPQ